MCAYAAKTDARYYGKMYIALAGADTIEMTLTLQFPERSKYEPVMDE